MSLTCELCGGTNFLKDQGVFVCQDCGCKYTLEEARETIARAKQEKEDEVAARRRYVHDPDSRTKPTMSQQGTVPAEAPAISTASDFSPTVGNTLQGAQAVNNYACQGWQLLLGEYQDLEHPSKEQQAELGERGRDVLALLSAAARLEPENHVQNLLIFGNCKEVADAAHATKYYDQDDEGKWRSHSFGLTVKLPGQSQSWDELISHHRSFIVQRYFDAHPDDERERADLLAQRKEINARLDELKGEKKSHGFFDFSGKREVKDRMKPVQAELAEVNRQISAIDRKADAYVEQRLEELESGFVRL